MFGALFVEDGVGVIDVDENFSGADSGERAQGIGNRLMAHLASGLAMSLQAEQFVVRPECAVKENDIATRHLFQPFRFEVQDSRKKAKLAGVV